MNRNISIGDRQRDLGVSISALRRWDEEGRGPKSIRTRGGQRRYEVVGAKDAPSKRITIAYARHLARRLSDSSFGEIRRQLEYKTTSRGGRVLFVNAFFPSSKLCHICLAKNECLTLPCISNSRSGVAFLSPGNLWTCDQMPSSQYQTCVGNAEARYGAAIRRCAQMDADTPGGGGINNPPPRPPNNPPNYPPPSCQFINGAVYCPAPGQTCSFINGYVYCGYSCQYSNGSVYCPAWQQTCNFINGAVYCGVNCQYLNGAVYCSYGGRGTPARPAAPSRPS